mgnify:CR=1 FL=1
MIILDGKSLDLEKFIQIARFKEEVSISEESKLLVIKARKFVDEVVESEKPVYGINTGFGKLSDMPINKCDVSELQKNLLMSHACGVGSPLTDEVVRGSIVTHKGECLWPNPNPPMLDAAKTSKPKHVKN